EPEALAAAALTQQPPGHASSLAAAAGEAPSAPAVGEKGREGDDDDDDDDDAGHDSGHSPGSGGGGSRENHGFAIGTTAAATATATATATSVPGTGSAAHRGTTGSSNHEVPAATATATQHPLPHTPTPTTTATSTLSSSGSAPGSGSPAAPNHPPASPEAQPTGAAPPQFVAPSSYLRPVSRAAAAATTPPPPPAAAAVARPPTGGSRPGTRERTQMQMQSPLDREQTEGLRAIRAFLKVRTSYDVLPLSYRLIVFDTSLLVKKSLSILTQQGLVSAPLWDSKTSTFAGLLTTSDYINVVQYYWQNPDALAQVDQFKLNSLRDIERAIGVTPIETVSIHPSRPLYEACRRMLESRARRIPLVD
ncbi:hypothetical protein B0A55_13414, partial [Friedmanniomyces simplex]